LCRWKVKLTRINGELSSAFGAENHGQAVECSLALPSTTSCIAAILLAMQNDPLVEWQRLTQHYSTMYDQELLELAQDSADLTETARQVLRSEMKKRCLDEQQAPDNAPVVPVPVVAPQWSSAVAPQAMEPADQQADSPHDFTWKTPLCECENREQAWQISEVLKQAGVESWIEPQGSYSPYSQLDARSPRIVVAADRLDQAREIVARPIPQAIVDQSQKAVPDFEAPMCPTCGAADPALEGVDPVNKWQCEACGARWSDQVAGMVGSG